MMKPKLLISACLCGKDTKYNGKNNLIKEIDALKEAFDLVLICPEVMGGLSIPRDPSEIRGSSVYSAKGKDVTEAYQTGAQMALAIARKNKVQYALLKERSPSCGKNEIYDGTFTGVRIRGEGITTRLLIQSGIDVYNELEINQLLAAVENIETQ